MAQAYPGIENYGWRIERHCNIFAESRRCYVSDALLDRVMLSDHMDAIWTEMGSDGSFQGIAQIVKPNAANHEPRKVSRG